MAKRSSAHDLGCCAREATLASLARQLSPPCAACAPSQAGAQAQVQVQALQQQLLGVMVQLQAREAQARKYKEAARALKGKLHEAHEAARQHAARLAEVQVWRGAAWRRSCWGPEAQLPCACSPHGVKEGTEKPSGVCGDAAAGAASSCLSPQTCRRLRRVVSLQGELLKARTEQQQQQQQQGSAEAWRNERCAGEGCAARAFVSLPQEGPLGVCGVAPAHPTLWSRACACRGAAGTRC